MGNITNVEQEMHNAKYEVKTIHGRFRQLNSELNDMDAKVNRLTKEFDEVQDMLSAARRKYNQYRILDDIRRGKLIPVVADTGEIASITFS